MPPQSSSAWVTQAYLGSIDLVPSLLLRKAFIRGRQWRVS